MRQFAPRGSTGVADYASALAPLLDFEAPAPLYHIGNNPLHAPIYRQALQQPGVVLLHDAVLHHLLLHLLEEDSYVSEFEYNYGCWMEGTARQLWGRRGQSAADEAFFRYPMLRRLAQRSLGVLVHNARAAKTVQMHAPATPVAVIPHLQAFESADRIDLGRGPVFGVFGYLRPTKRIRTVIEAARRTGSQLLIAGEPAPPPGDFCWLPLAQETEFRARLNSVDVVVNLRYPSAAETSGVTIAAMALGKPVILTADGESRDFPAGTHAAVEAGASETASLAATMHWLAHSISDRLAMGAAAQRYLRTHHSLPAVQARIREFVQRVVI